MVGEVVSQLRSGRSKALPGLLRVELSEVSRRVAKLSNAGESGMARLVTLTKPKPDSTLAEIASWIWSAASAAVDDSTVLQAGRDAPRDLAHTRSALRCLALVACVALRRAAGCRGAGEV